MGESLAALKIYKKLRKRGFQVEERAMNTLLRGLCRKYMSLMDGDLLKESEYLFARIVEKGYTTLPYTFCLMVQARANGGEIDKALAYLHQMIRNGYSPRMITYNIVLLFFVRKGESMTHFMFWFL